MGVCVRDADLLSEGELLGDVFNSMPFFTAGSFWQLLDSERNHSIE